MNNKNQVVLNLQGLGVPDKLQMSNGFTKAITGNKHFGKAGDLLTQIKEAAGRLDVSYALALELRQQSVTQTAIVGQDEAVLDGLLTALAKHVEMESFGDEAKIKSAGMSIKNKAVPVGTPLRPEGLVVAEGKTEGALAPKWKSVRGAKSYVIRGTTSITDTGSWQQLLVVTKTSALLEGLKSGQQYWLQVAAVGAAGQGPWSDPATKVVP